jgi:dihydrofolate synthase/folylpolyglutamate synthase
MPPVTPSFQRALDEIFAGYLRAKPALVGRLDRETRTPEAIAGLARRLGLAPGPDRLVRVTGSKGKGSVTRLVAAALSAALPGEPVGRVTSPEEVGHTDRIHLDGAPIPEADFARIWDGLRGEVEAAARALPPGRYLSPSGLFLLVGLAWFRERGARHLVVEGGRGVRWDEIGQFPSRVGVLTAILREHAEYLGPGIEDIAADKLSILEGSARAVLGPLARPWAPAGAAFVAAGGGEGEGAREGDAPAWVAEDAAIAEAAATAYLDRPAPVPRPLPNLPSFGRGRIGGIDLTYEGLIARDSFDARFWRRELAGGPALVLLSLPDDKDVAGVEAGFAQLGLAVRHLALHGERGRLSHAAAEATGRVAARLPFDDAPALAALLPRLAAEAGVAPGRGRLALAGTQTFLRLLKRALAGG